MDVRTCQRCGQGFVELDAPQGGRPRRWCSESCRRSAFEERRAARSAKPRDRTTPPVARSSDQKVRRRRPRATRPQDPPAAQPITRDAAIRRILDDTEATTELLHQLADRARDEHEPAAVQRWRARQHRPPIDELYNAYHPDTGKPPPPTPRTHDAQALKDAIARSDAALKEVLASPRLAAAALNRIFSLALTGRLDTPAYQPVKTILDEILTTLTPPPYIDPIANLQRRQQDPAD